MKLAVLDKDGTITTPKSGNKFVQNLLATRSEVDDAWMIGDRDEDRLAAESAGFNFLDATEWHQGATPWVI